MTRFARSSAILLAALVLTSAGGFAAVDDRKARISTAETLEIPGGSLEPGVYIMELTAGSDGKSVVVFRDGDSDKPIATVHTQAIELSKTIGQSELTFYETPGDEPPALRTWFHQGLGHGHEFIYPESRGREIAKSARRNVPTMSDGDFKKLAAGEEYKGEISSFGPNGQRSKLEAGWAYNQRVDSKTWRPDEIVRSEPVESRLQQIIRKEIVTLPFYSVWDRIEFRLNDQGHVHLMGSVYRPTMKKSIERVVERIEGVTKVTNDIEILPVSPMDDEIRRAVYFNIYSHPALQQYQLRAVPPIHIIVSNGNVALEGVVANEMDKNIAGMQANTVGGVFKVENNLRTDSR